MEYAYAYARFSSDRQNETSIDAQLRAIREYAARHGIEIIGVYVDEAVSGKGSATQKRREYQRMLRDIRKHQASVVLVHKWDRVARNVGEHVNLEMKLQAENVRIVAVAQDFGSNSEGRLTKVVMWALSEYYIDNLASETRKGLKETALKGLHTGGVAPFGYKIVDQRYEVDPYEAYYVQRMFTAALERTGFKDIVAEMAAADIVGHRGAPIRYPQIYEILRNEKYAGVYAYSPEEEKSREARRSKPNAIRVEGAVPPIVTKEVFDKVQKIMEGRKHMGRKGNYLCSGLVYCQCGARMQAMTTHRKGHEYRRYRCPDKCGAHIMDMDVVDDAARAYLQELLTPEVQADIIASIRKYQDGAEDRMGEYKTVLSEKILEKQAAYDNLMANLSSGALPPSVAKDVGRKMQEIQAQIQALKDAPVPEDFTSDQIVAWMDSIKAAPDEKAIRLLIERIDIKDTTVSSITSTLSTVVNKTGCGGRT